MSAIANDEKIDIGRMHSCYHLSHFEIPYSVLYASRFCRLGSLVLATVLFLANSGSVSAEIVFGSFGRDGEGGSANGQLFTFGSGGEFFEVDSFLNISGSDLNGSTVGSSAQLSIDPLPSGLSFSFTPLLSSDKTDLTLRYEFTNQSGGAFSDVKFFPFVDAQIDEPTNTYFNEAGDIAGSLGTGVADSDPDSFEIDEPGFVFGNIFDNLRLGSLDNTNNVPSSFPDDVSMALGFDLGSLNPLDKATVDVFLSEDGDSIGSFSLLHFDTDAGSADTLTLSGQSSVTAVPEPSAIFLMALFPVVVLVTNFRRRVRAQADGRFIRLRESFLPSPE